VTALMDQGALPVRRSQRAAALWRRALVAWAVMAVAMTLNGIFRVTLLVPRCGEAAAGVISAVLGILLIQAIVWRALQAERPSSVQRLAIAALWLMLTVGFECTFGHWIGGKSWSELWANYNLAQGRLWPIVLASLVAAPFLWGRRSA
jgi:hypothetical protein